MGAVRSIRSCWQSCRNHDHVADVATTEASAGLPGLPRAALSPLPVGVACQGSAAALIGRNAGTGMADAFYALEKLADALYALATAPAACRSAWATRQSFLSAFVPRTFPTKTCAPIFIGVMDDLSYAQSQGGDEGNIRAAVWGSPTTRTRVPSLVGSSSSITGSTALPCESADPPGAVDLTYCCTGHGWRPTEEGWMAP